MTSVDIQALNERIFIESGFVETLTNETGKVIIGQTTMIERLLMGLDGKFSRIQFTPDLLPADIIGTMIYNPAKNDFSVRKGPIFANFVLADEINRAPAKVQSALLEAMQERQEQEGTYPLPEAQTDRFMLKVKITYPTKEEEQIIMRQNIVGGAFEKISAVVDTKTILNARKTVRSYLPAANLPSMV